MELFDRIKLSRNILILLAGATGVLMLFGGLFIASSPRPKPQAVAQGKIQEVTLDNGVVKLKVKRNGVVEVTTPERVFFQYWDEDRVNKLFRLLEEVDWGQFPSRLKPGEAGYVLILTTDQGIITIAIPLDSLIPEAIQELIQLVEEITQLNAPRFSPLPSASTPPPAPASPTPQPSPVVSPSPTPSPPSQPLPSATPTPTATPTSGGPAIIQQLFACEYTGTTAKKRILSETLCDLLE